jgi:hypothetical protein
MPVLWQSDSSVYPTDKRVNLGMAKPVAASVGGLSSVTLQAITIPIVF